MVKIKNRKHEFLANTSIEQYSRSLLKNELDAVLLENYRRVKKRFGILNACEEEREFMVKKKISNFIYFLKKNSYSFITVRNGTCSTKKA